MSEYYCIATYNSTGNRHINFQISPFDCLESAITACKISYNNLTKDELSKVSKVSVLTCEHDGINIKIGDELWSEKHGEYSQQLDELRKTLHSLTKEKMPSQHKNREKLLENARDELKKYKENI